MAEARSDWRVEVVVDRAAVKEDVTRMLRLVERPKFSVTVSAASEAEARQRAEQLLRVNYAAGPAYVLALYPRRLPTGVP